MSHDDWRDPSSRAAVHARHIAAANAARAHPHQDFVGLQFGNRNLLDGETARILEDESFHAESLQGMVIGSTSGDY